MSEVKAVSLGLAAMWTLTALVCTVLLLMEVNAELISAALVVIGVAGAFLLSQLVIHYKPPGGRQR